MKKKQRVPRKAANPKRPDPVMVSEEDYDESLFVRRRRTKKTSDTGPRPGRGVKGKGRA
jgi:hypothetical protein